MRRYRRRPSEQGREATQWDIRQPTLYDISGSAHWFNASDHGVIVCGDTKSNVREVVVEKSRYRGAGAPGSAWLRLEYGCLRATVSP